MMSERERLRVERMIDYYLEDCQLDPRGVLA